MWWIAASWWELHRRSSNSRRIRFHGGSFVVDGRSLVGVQFHPAKLPRWRLHRGWPQLYCQCTFGCKSFVVDDTVSWQMQPHGRKFYLKRSQILNECGRSVEPHAIGLFTFIKKGVAPSAGHLLRPHWFVASMAALKPSLRRLCSMTGSQSVSDVPPAVLLGMGARRLRG